MISYLVKKGLVLLTSFWLILSVTFVLMHCIPGDPFIGDRVIPEEVLESLFSYYGLDQPLGVQYWKFLKSLCHGDLGVSIVYQGRSVKEFISEGFPVSLQLGLQALLLSISLGVFLGSFSAMKRGKWQDFLLMALSTLGISAPSFIFSILLQYIFCVKWPILPVARWGGFEHTILPTLSLSVVPTAFIARLIRTSLLQVFEQDYIRTAFSKGLSPFYVFLHHGLKNALLPVLSYLGPLISSLFTGSFIIEKIFAIPGLGQWMIQSIHGRDYPVILGLTSFYSAFLLLCIFATEILYPMLDPRIRLKTHA